jgi:hypothetical protein
MATDRRFMTVTGGYQITVQVGGYDTTRYRKEFCQGIGKVLKPIQNVGQPSDETQATAQSQV